jgi:ornithine cyclodeaminase/alanine dehydrogenase-like protein (mu-crystallin family)
MTLPDVRAEIGQVIAGTAPGRQTNEEIVVFDSTGSAVQDAAPAAAVYLAARSPTETNLWAA